MPEGPLRSFQASAKIPFVSSKVNKKQVGWEIRTAEGKKIIYQQLVNLEQRMFVSVHFYYSSHLIFFFFGYRQWPVMLLECDGLILQTCLKDAVCYFFSYQKRKISSAPGNTFQSVLKITFRAFWKFKVWGYGTLIWINSSWKDSDHFHRRSVMVTVLSTTVTWLQLQNRGGSFLCG